MREPANLLERVPVRRVGWQECEGRVVVVRALAPPGTVRRGLGERLRQIAATPRIRLDAHGSFLWLRMDGAATVADLAEMLHAEFGEAVHPSVERVGSFVVALEGQALVKLRAERTGL